MNPHDDERRRGPGLFWMTAAAAVLALTLGAALAVPYLLEARRKQNETAAIGALKTIGAVQAGFRECDWEHDGNLDYGTLEELGLEGRRIDAELASGTKHGYVFECSYSASTSEFLWFATARPLEPGVTGDRYFATNHEGVTYYTTEKAFRLNTVDCTMPSFFRDRPMHR